MGNFYQGGEQFYLQAPDFEFSGVVPDGNLNLCLKKGWLHTTSDDGLRVTTSHEYWAYSQTLVPGILANNICNEAHDHFPTAAFAPRLSLEDIASLSPGVRTVLPTANINGWDITPTLCLHNSWRTAYSLLGWSRNTAPANLQTDLNISTSSIKWVSDKSATMTGLKLHASTQLYLSTNGNPLQAYNLSSEDGSTKP